MKKNELKMPDIPQSSNVLKAKSLTISDDYMFSHGAELLVLLNEEKKEIKKQTEDIIKQAYKLHKQLKGDQTALLKPIEEAENHLKAELGRYKQLQDKLKYQQSQQAIDVSKQAEDDMRIKLALDAENRGDSKLAEDIISQISTPASIYNAGNDARIDVINVSKERQSGISFIKVYDVDVFDMQALVAYVADNMEFINLLAPDINAIKQYAKSTNNISSIPGVSITVREQAKATGR